MNINQKLSLPYYPKAGDNARMKGVEYRSTKVIVNATSKNYQFFGNLVNPYDDNQKLPPSGTEVFVLRCINASFNNSFVGSLVQLRNLLHDSKFKITVNNRTQLECPLHQILNLELGSRYTGQSADSQELDWSLYANKKEFLFPIVFNSQSSYSVEIQLSENFNVDGNFTLYFSGIQYDKLSSYYADFRKDKDLNTINYTIFDTLSVDSTIVQNLDLFKDTDKPLTRFSKTFPLSNIESFTIERLQISMLAQAVDPDTMTLEEFREWQRRAYLTIIVNDVKMANISLFNSAKNIFMGNQNVLVNATDTLTKESYEVWGSGYVFYIPISVPTTSDVDVKFYSPAQSGGALGILLTSFCLDGTLNRGVV